MQEFLDIKQMPNEGIRHLLSRFKGFAFHCDFSVDCVCQKKVSYTDSLTKFKLVSGLVDSEIKEYILVAEDKSLEDTVKAIEAKESAKRAKVKLGVGMSPGWRPGTASAAEGRSTPSSGRG